MKPLNIKKDHEQIQVLACDMYTNVVMGSQPSHIDKWIPKAMYI